MKDFLKNPLIPLLSILFFSAAYIYLPFSDTFILKALLVVFTILTFISPLNGINIIFTIFPFCLGDSKRAYFVYIEYIVLVIIISFFIHYLIYKEKKAFIPFKWVIIFFVISSIISLPLNLREISYYILGTPFLEVFKAYLRGHEGNPVFFIRVFTNYFSGFILFFFAGIFLDDRKKIKNALTALFWTYMISLLFSILIYFHLIEFGLYKFKFLTASLKGSHPITYNQIAFCGFAFNPGYFGQYIIITIPFYFYFLYLNKENKIRASIILILTITGLLILPFTYQRGPIIALIAEIFFIGCSFIFLSKNWKKISLIFLFLTMIFILTLILIDFIANDFILVKRLSQSFTQMSLRDKIWKVAFTMFKDQPFLGIGIGQFHSYFRDYCKLAEIPFAGHLRVVRSTAHNVYLHILAEQGIIGILAFISIIFSVYKKYFTNIVKFEKKEQYLLVASMTALTGILAFGFTQHIFYVRSVQLFFWIVIAIIASIIKSHYSDVKISKKHIYSYILIIFSAFIYRFIVIWNYKV